MKIEFLWRALKFRRGHGPLFSAAYEMAALGSLNKVHFDTMAILPLYRGCPLVPWCYRDHTQIIITFSFPLIEMSFKRGSTIYTAGCIVCLCVQV